jgi:hypothetical protein
MSGRTIHQTLPEEAARLDQAAARIEAEAAEIAERLLRWEAAERDTGFRGELRRSIRDSLIGPERLATEASIDLDRLESFREGAGDLTLSECDAISVRLGLVIHVTSPAA